MVVCESRLQHLHRPTVLERGSGPWWDWCGRYGFKPGDNVLEQRAARDPVDILSLRVSGAEDIEGIRFLPESTLLLWARMASEGRVDDQEGNNVLWYV